MWSKTFEKYTKIHFTPYLEDDICVGEFRTALENENWFIYEYKKHGNWIKNLGSMSYNEYYSTLPSKIKNTILRKEKKLNKEKKKP